MEKDIERYQNMQSDPGTYVFKGDTVGQLARALTKAADMDEPRLVVRLGRREDGTPCMWLDVKGVAAIDTSFNCPPLPPEECE